MLQLRRERPQKLHSVFSDLDRFISRLPLPSPSVDYAVARIAREGSQKKLHIELAGGIRAFSRDEATGAVQFHDRVGHPPLGFGLVTPGESREQTENLSDGAAVFLASDGLFDIQTGTQVRSEGKETAEQFEDVFNRFCENTRGASNEAFLQAIVEYAHRAKEGGRTTDDITVLRLDDTET